jgi:hypothetical protein
LRTREIAVKRRVNILGVLLLVLLSAVTAAGCGTNIVQKAIEGATGVSVPTVEVDTGSGSVSISGDNGKTQIATGGNAKIPEGFPSIALPEGAQVTQAISMGSATGQSDMVGFSCGLSNQLIFDHFMKAVPDAGFTIQNKLEMKGTDGALSQFSIWADDAKRSVVVMGGQSDATGGGTAFTIQVVPK